MQIHGVGRGPNVPIEDARAVLHAYWNMAEKRMIDSAIQAIEHVLLVTGSQAIEAALLEFGQNVCSIKLNKKNGDEDPGDMNSINKLSLEYLFEENPEHTLRRNQLSSLKSSLEIALQKIKEVCPSLM